MFNLLISKESWTLNAEEPLLHHSGGSGSGIQVMAMH